MTDFVYPTSTDDFTPDYVTGVLRAGGHLPNGTVASVATEPIGAGVGIVGQLARLSLTFDGDAGGLPATMVAKFPSPYPMTKDVAQFYGFYRTEAECYEEAKRGGLGVDIPQSFLARTSADDRDTLLLIEDLSHLRMADQVAGASLPDAEALIDAAAQLHAKWWQSPELDRLSWLRPANNPAYKASQQQYEQVWPMFVEQYGDRVAPGSLAIAERHSSQIAAYFDWVMEQRPLTVMHADYRLDNFFFDDAAKRVVIIDWQLTVRGVGAQDVSYFILQSMTTEDRRAHDERLVRRWYDGLVANGVSDYSWDDAWTDFRRAALGQLTIAVIGAGSMDPGNDRGRALMDAMALRNFQGLVDYDCGALHLD